ncbi:tumor necrosis factor receptor superfamily member 11B-like [Megalops cyprinoides]|uniref:tumor necrosis factor receptor superfamily member 11B-like n=1 Tax=Megalops cyprinoides TaxID=118141 RepID=UPI00186404E0|nr:tumor necrosis factor receptor superfamily member 11B-like [Megalops cyprinoides]
MRPRSTMKLYVVLSISFSWAFCQITPPTYQHRDPVTSEVYLCKQCPPGTAVRRHCDANTPTACVPCPEGYFSEQWHWGQACQRCTSVCKEGQLVRWGCNGTHDQLCECVQGYHLEVEFCVRHSTCPPGWGATVLGSSLSDTVCGKCPKGFFSSSFSATEPCFPHRNCSELGKKTFHPGTANQNSVCEGEDRGPTLECFQQHLQCQTDIMLCEEVILQFLASIHFLSTLPLDTVTDSLPGRKVDRSSVEQIKKECSPKQQVLQLFRLWRQQNRDRERLFGIIQGVNHCSRMVSRCVGLKNLTLSHLKVVMEGLPGLKVREEDIQEVMDSCQPRQYLLKLLQLWKIHNGERDLAKGLSHSLRELRAKGISHQLLRVIRSLSRLFSTSSIHKLYKKMLLNLFLDGTCFTSESYDD